MNCLLKKFRKKSKYFQKQITKHDNLKPMGCCKSSSKNEAYSSIILPQEIRKTSKKQPNFTPKTIDERTTTTTKKHQSQKKSRSEQKLMKKK